MILIGLNRGAIQRKIPWGALLGADDPDLHCTVSVQCRVLAPDVIARADPRTIADHAPMWEDASFQIRKRKLINLLTRRSIRWGATAERGR